ncbi:ATP synthase subunit I [Derxia gummosa]|uniref:ATP synthase subunit I n=1 Tax=Derxia gummosa DSM 723 TaxID=1121388 RepID=A0A9U5C6D7_9BURK|nr:ATP synthase subunit I [Derxia gummosa]
MPLKIVLTQLAVTIAVALVAGAVGGVRALVSAALAGFACVLPNALFALRLMLATRRPGGANPASFLIGEVVKVGLTILLLFAVAKGVRDLSWPAYIAGMIAALQSVFVVLLIRK